MVFKYSKRVANLFDFSNTIGVPFFNISNLDTRFYFEIEYEYKMQVTSVLVSYLRNFLHPVFFSRIFTGGMDGKKEDMC